MLRNLTTQNSQWWAQLHVSRANAESFKFISDVGFVVNPRPTAVGVAGKWVRHWPLAVDALYYSEKHFQISMVRSLIHSFIHSFEAGLYTMFGTSHHRQVHWWHWCTMPICCLFFDVMLIQSRPRLQNSLKLLNPTNKLPHFKSNETTLQ